MYICSQMGEKTTYILQLILAITGVLALCTTSYILGFLLLFFSYLVWNNKLEIPKTDWLDLYNSQNRVGKRRMKRCLKRKLVGKKKFR